MPCCPRRLPRPQTSSPRARAWMSWFETHPTGTSAFFCHFEKGTGRCSGSIDRGSRPAGRSFGDHPGDERNQTRYEDGFEQSALRPACRNFISQLGKDAEFVYSATFWEASLPNPGNRDFVTAYQMELHRAPAVQNQPILTPGVRFLRRPRDRRAQPTLKSSAEALLSLRTKDRPRRLCLSISVVFRLGRRP